MANYYLGTVLEVLDPDLYEIRIDIPGLAKEVVAYPIRGELDEPRPGDQVLVRDLDPVFHSFYLYSELKEDQFIGIRSRGKIVEIKKEEITIGIFNPDEKYENSDPPVPKITSWIKIDKEGNMDIKTEKEINIKCEANVKLDVPQGNVEVSSFSTKVDSQNVEITGGSLKVDGSVFPTYGGGPFCAIPVCPLTGAPHVGPRVLGT